MNIVSVLHNKAMEFADEALLAKMQGNFQVADTLFGKAFDLEKEAIEAINEDQKDTESRYILIRSAVSLAFNCNKHHEAKALIKLGLSGNAPDFIIQELNSLNDKINEVHKHQENEIEMKGVIIYANANNNQIQLQDLDSKELYTINVPPHLINEIVRSYWADTVRVQVQKAPTGSIHLSKIRRAA